MYHQIITNGLGLWNVWQRLFPVVLVIILLISMAWWRNIDHQSMKCIVRIQFNIFNLLALAMDCNVTRYNGYRDCFEKEGYVSLICSQTSFEIRSCWCSSSIDEPFKSSYDQHRRSKICHGNSGTVDSNSCRLKASSLYWPCSSISRLPSVTHKIFRLSGVYYSSK